MSILNSFAPSASGGGNYKVATALPTNDWEIEFSVESEPTEWFMAITSGASSAMYLPIVSATADYVQRGNSSNSNSNVSMSTATLASIMPVASYSNGIYTIQFDSNTGRLVSVDNYNLFYK